VKPFSKGDLDQIPLSTYRLGFHKGFRLSQATRILSYLEKLGLTTLYASPLFSARSGSTHGYDVIDPTRLNPEIGTLADLERLSQGIKSRKMGLILDIVPNHMAAHFENPWWRDLLENGEASSFSMFFDVDWDPPQRALAHRISLPILGAAYGKVLENRELELVFGKNGFGVRYWNNVLPADPASLGPVLLEIQSLLPLDTREESQEALSGIDSLLEEIDRIPPRTPSPIERRLRARTGKKLQKLLWDLFCQNPLFREALERTLAEYKGIRGIPSSFDRMDRLLNAQVYWLSHWKTITRTLNYRRFFDVADLVGVRAEDERVFDAFHRLVREWTKKGWVDGVRVDHVDGLLDPAGYLLRLSRAIMEERPDATPLIWVEKILAAGESLPSDWPVAGTTGYEFAAWLTRVFGDPDGTARLRRWYEEELDKGASYSDIVYHQKKYVSEILLGGELRRLTLLLEQISQEDRAVRETDFRELQAGLVEISACLSVYRTYILEQTVREVDRQRISMALNEARRRHPNRRQGLYRFFERVLTLSFGPETGEERRARWISFVEKWQQFTGPVMAKGVEDSSFYLYSPLISSNEVGGDPCLPPASTTDFHGFNRERLENYPLTLSTTSTHDSKRSEDVRARIQAISEHADEWIERVGHWRRWNRSLRFHRERSTEIPSPPLEHFLYQTLAGAWPLDSSEVPEFKKRISSYLVKVLRESKHHSNWISPNIDYEEAVCSFSREILREDRKNLFLKDFLSFQKRLAIEGASISLAGLLLKLTSPGIPDFYQGCELWDFSLVDPDNRRPVDFKKRMRLLDRIESEWREEPVVAYERLLDHWQDGGIKMFMTQRLLTFRKLHPDLFLEGEYRPLPLEWEQKNHMLGFIRRLPGKELIVAVSLRARDRLDNNTLIASPDVFRKGRLPLPPDSPSSGWRHLFTNRKIAPLKSGESPALSLDKAMGRTLFTALVRMDRDHES
jgi:(1->4)-alpha-D-glucan 1-alpha-D-glucosylmutase